MSPKVGIQTYKLPAALAASVKTNLEDWRAGDKVRRTVEARRFALDWN